MLATATSSVTLCVYQDGLRGRERWRDRGGRKRERGIEKEREGERERRVWGIILVVGVEKIAITLQTTREEDASCIQPKVEVFKGDS